MGPIRRLLGGHRAILLAVTAVVAALLGCQQVQFLTPATATPTGIPQPGRVAGGTIAFLDVVGNVGTIRADGSQITAMTDDAGPQDDTSAVRRYGVPAWSQVSDQLAFTERVQGPSGQVEERVEVIEVGSGDRETVFERTGSSPFYLYWAPHAPSLTFLASRIGQTDLELWLWSGGDVQRLDQGQPYYWAWSPLGDLIITHVGGAGQTGRIGRLIGPGDATVAVQETPALFQAPAISPDGRQVVVSADSGPSGSLMLLDADGGLIRELTAVNRAVAFDWSPDGDLLAFVEQRSADIEGFGELMLLDPNAESDPRPTGVEQVAAFFWSPTGERIATLTPVLEPQGQDEQIRRGLQSAELRLRLAVYEVGSGKSRTVTEFVPTSQFLSILPFYDQYQRSSTIWSPDGQGLVFTGRRTDGFGGLFVVDLAQDNWVPRLITRAELAFWSFVE